ncbi:hypothetical protein N7465_006283 [Penicillium sp. CMV-2018d]|nr:hypothetical protein N7465_006283 [Penicillium sp. CMV-2018d]
MGTHFFKQKVLRTSNVTSWKDMPLPAAWRETPANASNVLDEEAFGQYLSVVDQTFALQLPACNIAWQIPYLTISNSL